MNKRPLIVAGWLLLAGPSIALAQPGATILDQNRADRAPPSAAPQGPLNVQPSPADRAQGPGARVTPFVLTAVRISGGNAPEPLLRAAWAPYVGKTMDAAQLKALADAVAATYGRSDVALYTVITPNQTFAGGVVQLAVIEGFVEQVTLTGNGAGPMVKAYVRKLQQAMPLRRSKLERYMSLMRDLPGVTIEAQLLRGTRPGGVILAIAAKKKRFEGALSVNNRGTAYLGQTQVRGDLWLDGFPIQGGQTRLTYATPTDFQRFQYYGVGQILPLGTEGTTLTVSGGYIRTRPAYTPVTGAATTWGAQVSHPLVRGYEKNLYLTGGVDGVDSTNAAFGQTLFTEKVRTGRAAAAYSVQTPRLAWSLAGTLSAGLPGLGARTLVAGYSDTGFTKLNLGAKWSRAVGKPWVVRLDAAAQITGSKLPGSELFSLGGDEFGRAFPSSIAIGDEGVAGSAELAYRPQRLPVMWAGSEVYGFVDGGQTRYRTRPFILNGYTQDLTSGGIGIRAAYRNKGMLQIEAADAVDTPLPGQSGGWRLTVSVRSMMN